LKGRGLSRAFSKRLLSHLPYSQSSDASHPSKALVNLVTFLLAVGRYNGSGVDVADHAVFCGRRSSFFRVVPELLEIRTGNSPILCANPHFRQSLNGGRALSANSNLVMALEGNHCRETMVWKPKDQVHIHSD
jgi:hypothetical protein